MSLPAVPVTETLLNLLRRDTGEDFGQDTQNGLQGLTFGPGVMFFDDILLLIDHDCIGTYRANIQP